MVFSQTVTLDNVFVLLGGIAAFLAVGGGFYAIVSLIVNDRRDLQDVRSVAKELASKVNSLETDLDSVREELRIVHEFILQRGFASAYARGLINEKRAK